MINQVYHTHPDKKIRVVDTKAASMGEGLMVEWARKMKEEGKSMDEVADFMEANQVYHTHLE